MKNSETSAGVSVVDETAGEVMARWCADFDAFGSLVRMSGLLMGWVVCFLVDGKNGREVGKKEGRLNGGCGSYLRAFG